MTPKCTVGCVAIIGALLLPAHALPECPATLTRAPSEASGHVTLAWSEVSGATTYQVKRGTSPTSNLTTLATVGTTSYIDTTATPGVFYYYTVTTMDSSGESPPTRGIFAATGVIVDDGGPGTSFTGTWQTSFVAGHYGSLSLFASPVAGTTPTATYTFTPQLPARGNYDVYLRWTTHANRATNTPVDLNFADGSRTVTVNQQLNNGVWMPLTNITAASGTSTSLTIRNNGANGNVIADAVQFIPRHAPWSPPEENLSEYTLLPVDDHFDGTALDTTTWATFQGRSEYHIAGGLLHTKLRYIGSVPLASATTADLENEANWTQGGIIAKEAQKFGFHEARIRLPQIPARGVDTAYWHNALDELFNGYEIDAPEFFHKDTSGAANNHGFGVWDHIDGARTWDYTRNNSTLGNVAQYITIGLDWRTDNTQVVYINGAEVFTAPTSGMNDTESILPSNIILSTKVLDWLRPNTALDGAKTTWDYARYYQKPGFLGALDGDWSKPGNWGPEGLPAPGRAAVFNMPNAPAAITLPADQTIQSLYLDHPSLPAHTFGGPGPLRLGAGISGDSSATHGGILVNTTVASNQTIDTPVIGVSNLQFANLSRKPGAALILNGLITGDGIAPRDVDFISALATHPNCGLITLGQALGSGLRHINRAGDSVFHLPSNNLHTGELRIARGPVSITSISALGTTPDSAVVFRPNYKHSESWRPRLTYTGTGETSAHVIKLGAWQADGILESIGSGPLVWSGNVAIAPFSAIAKRVLTRDISLTLGATVSSGENLFSGTLSDAGVNVTYLNADNSPNTGPAILRITKAGSGSWTLSGNNAYSGTTTINGGTLEVTSLNSVNNGIPPRSNSSLGTPKTIETGTIAITSGTLRYTGSGETTDRIIHLAGSSGATLDQSGTGLLKFTSDFLSHASTKTLTLTGSGSGEISGMIPDNSPSNKTNLSKSGTGTWILSGSNTYTGTTTISSGTLDVSGSIAPGGNLTVSISTGRLTGSGSIATPATINGTLATSPLGFTNTLTFGSSGKLQANFTGNSATGIGPVNASTVTITNGAKVDVTLNSPGSTTNFLQSYWRSARSIPILTANSKTGTLAIGTITADSTGNNSASYGAFSLQQSPTAVNLIWTPIPGFPDIDDPTLTLISPRTNPVSLTDTFTALRIAASVGNGATLAWSQLTGPGTVTFGDPSAADTTARFPTAGTYLIRATASNALGTTQADLTVNVDPPLAITFRQGENSYHHQATFIRGDSPAWNSGARDQILIGRNNGGMRGLIEFDLSQIPAGSRITAASLDLWLAGTGTGTLLNTLSIHELLSTFTEGSGDGNSAINGTGTGADWTHRKPSIPWSAAGAAAGTEYATTPLASTAGFNPSTTAAGTQFTFTSAALASANSQTLGLLMKMDADESGPNVFARFASDDHATLSQRPRLALTLNHDFAPAIDPGPAPQPTFGIATPLIGTVTNATASAWTIINGSGSVSFTDSSAASTTAIFEAPGEFLLSLSASNAHAETSRTLAITVLSNHESWRQTHFNTTAGTGDAAPDADPDSDGLTNFLEFAIGTLPRTANASTTYLTDSGSVLEFTYRRSHAAVADGVRFEVQWSDTLANDWSHAGVSHALVPNSDNGTSNQWKATLPNASGQKRFARLFVSQP
jgi:autotransporter-associated beta strand protein